LFRLTLRFEIIRVYLKMKLTISPKFESKLAQKFKILDYCTVTIPSIQG